MPPNPDVSDDWRRIGAATILSRRPLIIYTAITSNAPLGIGSLFSSRFGQYPATFLITPTWTIEQRERVQELHIAAESGRTRSQGNEFIFFCNTEEEQALLVSAGERALFVNHNAAISEEFYRPIEGVQLEYEAIYNARFDAFKRHELARKISSVAYIGYALRSAHREDVRSKITALGSRPGHVILNELKDGIPLWMSPRRVNEAYSQASVGLCLSASEGAMYASMEYMLAGLPVVSTPSKGGRDVFFNSDYCQVVRSDDDSVAGAVAEMAQRSIPRDDVRGRALTSIDPHRRRFLDVLNEILSGSGSARRFGPKWPFHAHPRLLRWDSFEKILPELSDIVADRSSDADASVLSEGSA